LARKIIPQLMCLGLALASVCAQTTEQAEEPAAYASAAELGSFCERLPRPAYKSLTPDAASDSWFEVYEVEPGVWAIYEPFQWQEVISYLIVGTESAVLFDTGNGIGDIRRVVAQLTDRPIRVLNSHSHFDHVGGNYQFGEILSPGTAFSLRKTAGVEGDAIREEVSPAALCRELPAGVDPDEHRVRPYRITGQIDDGDVLDIGGRELEVLRVPGHTDDAVALLDRKAGLLWSGDTFYEGPIWLFFPETDIAAYRTSVARLAALAPELRAVFPGHNTPRADPQLLIALHQSFEQVVAGKVEPEPVADGNVEFRFPGFSFLMRQDYYRLTSE
jgi:glyoxylase-like metal-dependent hydrolase (beta-lactamase superfamily II)